MPIARRLHPPARRRNEAGMALVFALFGLGALVLAGAAALLAGSGNLVATRNYRGAEQVHFAAESGLTRALQAVNAVGVVHFRNEVVDNWGSFLGAGTQNFALNGFRYSVVALADGTDPGSRGAFRATATGPEGMRSTVVALLTRNALPSTAPGAIYLANDLPTDAGFQGNAFLVDGNDHLLTGGPGPNAPVPGIATRNQTNTAETIGSLGAAQKDNIIGQGFVAGNPPTPSVLTAPSAPTVGQLDEIVDTLKSLANPANAINTASINGNVRYGTNAGGVCTNPQIWYTTSEEGLKIKGNGNASGCGILIVEGNLTIQGTFDWIGLILVAGATSVEPDWETGVTGNATVYGSLWTTDLNLNVGGSAVVNYSSEGLQFANNTIVTGALPAPMTVTALIDCTQVPAGSNGCP